MDMRTLQARARVLSREEFGVENPHLYLVVDPHFDESSIAFQTEEVKVGRKPVRLQPTELEVLPVSKAAGNPYPDRISIGRARNCDLVLRYPSVSKLHAHFRKLENGALELVDLGSQNGTMANGRFLDVNQSALVVAGDVLAFGATTAQLVNGGLLFDLFR